MIEHVITSSGEILRRSITENRVSITAQLMSTIAPKSTYKFGPVFNFHDMPVHLVVSGAGPHNNNIYAVHQLRHMHIRTSYRKSGDKLFPTLSADDNVMKLAWIPPKTMVLRLAYVMRFDLSHGFTMCNLYLVAFDITGKLAYRLPIGNVYNDCRVCTGMSEAKNYHHVQDLMADQYNAFDDSNWNSDLQSDNTSTQSMFYWTIKDNVFHPGAPEKWEPHCVRVANANIDMISL